jgi:geranylgeranyl diphosphate synthase type II
MSAISLEASLFDLKKYLAAKREVVDAELNRILDDLPRRDRLVDAIRHSLMSGGKRLRPILCMAAAEAVSKGGGRLPGVLSAACSLEMIHTYSLIHDDLPAMDDDDLRRGKPTCHAAFDEATAILAGDALLTMAFETLSWNASRPDCDHAVGLRIVEIVSGASGLRGMVGGQMADMLAEGRSISLEELQSMHKRKTGALIEASVRAGAVLAGAGKDVVEDLGTYAENIGLAFQVADDILNVEGDPALLGKAVGTDEKRRKNTYPSLMGLSESKVFAQKLVDRALKALSRFDGKSEPLRVIARYVIKRNR